MPTDPPSKACTKCDLIKPLTDFWREAKCRDGHKGECKDCSNERRRAWTAANPDKVRAQRRRYYEENGDAIRAAARAAAATPASKASALTRRRQATYGLSPEAAAAVSEVRFCQACGDSIEGRGRQVEHNHETGHVRFVACVRCNQIMGAIEDPKFTIVLATLARTNDPEFSWYADRLAWLEAHRGKRSS